MDLRARHGSRHDGPEARWLVGLALIGVAVLVAANVRYGRQPMLRVDVVVSFVVGVIVARILVVEFLLRLLARRKSCERDLTESAPPPSIREER